MKINILRYMIPALSLMACMEKQPTEIGSPDSACITLTVESDAPSKSSMLANESLVRDLNIWIYTSSGQCKESFYFDGLSITSSGSVNFTTTAGGHSKLIAIGNAGRVLTAPSLSSESVQIPMSYANDGAGLMLMVGEGSFSLTSTGMQSSVVMHRAMSRIALTVGLEPSLAAAGGVLGGNVRISRAGFFNSPSVVSLLPSAAWESVRTFKAVQGTSFASGDRISASDISTLCSGGTVYLYSLPNYTDIAYTDAPSSGTQYASYIEMLLEFDGIGNVGEGRVLCRFYANDDARIGLKGGCSYTCQVTVSNDGASNSWRKDDFRLDTPDTFLAGEIKNVYMHSRNHDAQAVAFSLSETPGVNETGVFRIGEKVTESYLHGVKVIAKTVGSGTLYCFNSNNELMGSVPMSSVWPQISISDKTLDVTGVDVPLDLQGLAGIYSKRASDELYSSLYSIASIEPLESVSGLYGQDFIYSGTSDASLYVDKLAWTRAGYARNWTDAVGKTFPYRATLACGITADFNVTVANDIVFPLRGSGYFGETFDVSEIGDPLPAVAALASQNTITANISASVPSSFCTQTRAQWQANGWRSWYGGGLLTAGLVADLYVDSWSSSGIRWILPSAATKSLYGETIPLYIGKLNPHCGEYVREMVGYYSSTVYHPVGVELYMEVVTFNSGAGTQTTTCLCFRPHSDGTVIDIAHGQFAYQGRDGGSPYSNHTSIGPYGYATLNNGDFLETNWDGDLNENSLFNNGSGPFYGTSDFTFNVRSPYNGSAFGAHSGKHLALYYYAPYTYQGGHAEIADENGHVSTKGHVSVEKWSVSSKAFFEWPEEEFVRPSSSGDL
ncbi:MAG: hypothetical protein J6X57_08435 [Bacteroidales bacterium]|nr:hypothetical protein [Bacteroidales bacterium]